MIWWTIKCYLGFIFCCQWPLFVGQNLSRMKAFLTIVSMALFISCQQGVKNPEENLEARAQKIHENVITIDTHVDINVANFTDSINYSQRLNTQVDIPKMEEGGLDVAWFIVYTGQDSLTDEGYEAAAENAMAKFRAIHRLSKDFAPDRIALATNSEEVRKIHASGKKVAMIGVENAYPIGEDLSLFEKYHELGARYISLAHNGHSQFSDSNTGEEDNVWLHNGLSELGKKAVNEMNRLGIMIDISHPSKEAIKQMINLSKAPLIASHSSARTLCNHSRNLDDELLDMVKENGGVVQTVAFSAYLNKEKNDLREDYMDSLYRGIADSMEVTYYSRREAMNELSGAELDEYIPLYREIRRLGREKAKTDPEAPPAVSIEDFVNHIDYMVDRIGIDHVGISSDFDGGGGIDGWTDASETFNVTLELVKRGYTEDEIAQLWGENLLRVLDEVQAYAKSINKTN